MMTLVRVLRPAEYEKMVDDTRGAGEDARARRAAPSLMSIHGDIRFFL
jgi:hypothetical protein